MSIKKSTLSFLFLSGFVLSSIAASAQVMSDRDPTHRPAPMYSKSEKKRMAKFRKVVGVVKDEHGNPVKGALVNLKNLKTTQTVTFITKADGYYMFDELSREQDYELNASLFGKTTPVKQLSHYDPQYNITRMLNFGDPEDATVQSVKSKAK